MRLIDADKLMQDLADEMLAKALDMLNYDNVEYMINRLASTPTAFNVDKVVEQLEKSHFHTDATFDDDGCCNDDSEEVVNLNEAIEIIRGGGLDD